MHGSQSASSLKRTYTDLGHLRTPERKALSASFSGDVTIMTASIDEVSRPKTPAQQRVEKYAEIGPSELALKLAATEDELTAHRLEGCKRLSLFLNRRLAALHDEWKEMQQHPAEVTSEAADQLSRAISEGRSALEDAAMMQLALQPEGMLSGAPPPSMRFAVKARFQGTPVSTLKAARVHQNWVGKQIDKQDDSGLPLFALGTGPAQSWRFRLIRAGDAALEANPSAPAAAATGAPSAATGAPSTPPADAPRKHRRP